MSYHKLKINLFGERWTLKKVILSMPEKVLLDSYCKKINVSEHQAVIDPFFYHFANNDSLKSIDDLKTITLQGLLNSPKNQIEIWFKNKKVQKLKMEQFNNDYLLFPLYRSKVVEINSKLENGIYLEQKEFGFISSFEFNLDDDFFIEDLTFHLINLGSKQILNKFTYNNKIPTEIKREPMIIYQNSFSVG